MKKHVKNKHPDLQHDLAPNIRDTKNYKYKCDVCVCQFNDIYNLNSHVRKMHMKTVEVRFHKLKKCPKCRFEAVTDKIKKHFHTEHDINIESVSLEFNDFNAFCKWKKNLEKEEKCKSISKWGKASSEVSDKYYYICHRSGSYIAEGKGLRHLKTQGSKKIDGYCPSEIKVCVNNKGVCSIMYCK